MGLEYGPSFRLVRALRHSTLEAIGEIAASEQDSAPETRALRLLDAGFQLVSQAIDVEPRGTPYVPVALERFSAWAPIESAQRARARAIVGQEGNVIAEVTFYDADNRPCARASKLELRRMSALVTPRAQSALWCYQPVWRERTIDACLASRGTGRWLVFEDEYGVGRRLAEGLSARGVDCVRCLPSGEMSRVDTNHATIDPGQASHYEQLISALALEPEGLAGVVLLSGLGPRSGRRPLSDTASALATSALHTVHALSHSAASAKPRLVVITRGAQAVAEGELGVVDPTPTTIWGLVKSMPLENPLLAVVCLDLDPNDEQDDVSPAIDELTSDRGEVEVAYRQGKRFVRRLVGDAGKPATGATRLSLRADATYVIAGGGGSLGTLLLERLASRGAEHVVLLSRRGRTRHPERVEAVRARGVDVRVIAVDVADRAALGIVFDSIRASGRPISGVVQAAGVLEDAALLQLDASSLRRCLAPKVAGSVNLHELTLRDPIDWFVGFSSAAGLLGSPGQANYSAANAFLDALISYRRSLSLPAVSVDWGPWDGEGMAVEFNERAARVLQTGASTIAAGDGLDAFEWLVASRAPQTLVLPFDLRDLMQHYEAERGMSFFEGILTADVSALKSVLIKALPRPPLKNEYVAPRNKIEETIANMWQRALGVAPVGVLDSFFELGGDSVFGNRMLVEVNRELGVSIAPKRAFDNLVVAHLAQLAEEQFIERLEQMSDEEAARLAQDLEP